jgi:cytochrome c peroxidase
VQATRSADSKVTPSESEKAALAALSPRILPPPPPDITNRFADEPRAAAFGKQLFSDPFMAGPLLDSDNDGGPGSLGKPGDVGKVACASCHVPERSFSDTRSFQLQVSLGAGWGRRRAPSLLDVGQAKLLMWDGRRDTLWNQPFGPIESVVEMNSSRLYAAEQVFRKYRATYEALFGPMPALDQAASFPQISATLTGCQPKNRTDPQPTCDGPFHGSPGDHAEFDGMSPAHQTAVSAVIVNVGKALAAYERTLACGPSRFDAWVRGDGSALSRSAQRGALLFVGKGQCVGCHSGPYLSDQKFHNVGLQPITVQQAFIDANDRGAATGIAAALLDPVSSRGSFSDGNDGRLPSAVSSEMEGAFRTPGLRCVSRRPSFMHTGQIRTLLAVVQFFDRGGSPSGYPGKSEISALRLTPVEVDDLTEFLAALDGLADPLTR